MYKFPHKSNMTSPERVKKDAKKCNMCNDNNAAGQCPIAILDFKTLRSLKRHSSSRFFFSNPKGTEEIRKGRGGRKSSSRNGNLNDVDTVRRGKAQ